MREIDKLPYEVWYKGPTGNQRRMAAFHMRFMAEKFIECQNDKERFYLVVLRNE